MTRPPEGCGVPDGMSAPDIDRRSALVRAAEAFKANVTEGHPDDCWLWTGKVMRIGYGWLYFPAPESRTVLAHRFAYELAHGPADGLLVAHWCENRRCVNPRHLWLATKSEVERHKAARGVSRNRHSGKAACDAGHPFTPENTIAKKGGRRNCRTCKNLQRRRTGVAA